VTQATGTRLDSFTVRSATDLAFVGALEVAIDAGEIAQPHAQREGFADL